MYGAALASIHAFYSLAVSAHADRTTSYHLASPAPNATPLTPFWLSLSRPLISPDLVDPRGNTCVRVLRTAWTSREILFRLIFILMLAVRQMCV